MPFLTDEDHEPPWDPFAAWAERAKPTEAIEPDAEIEPPVPSWGNGAYGRPSEVDPDEQMSRVIRGQWEWLTRGIPPRPHIPAGLGLVPFND